MNKVLIIDASPTDGRIMYGLLTRARYEHDVQRHLR